MGKSTSRILWLGGTVIFLLFLFFSFRTFLGGGLNIGDPLPAISVVDMEGRRQTPEDWRGKNVVLRFSSVACAACEDDFDLLNEWHRHLGDDVQFIAVQAGDTEGSVRRHLMGRRIDIPVWIDTEGRLVDALGIRFVPAIVFVTSRGTLSSVSNNEITRTDMQTHLNLLLSGGSGINADLKHVSLQLRCQECEGRSIWESDAPSSLDMRQRVHSMLLNGLRKEEVIASFEEEYGPWILMSPPVRGFTSLVWILPISGLGIGLGVWGTMMQRSRRKLVTDTRKIGQSVDHDELVRRIDETLG